MRKYRKSVLVFFPLFLFLTAGCGQPREEEDDEYVYGPRGPKPVKVRTPLEAVLDGTIQGRVVFDAALPPREMQPGFENPQCKDAPKEQQIKQAWIVGNNRGVANVVVYLKPPRGKFFHYDQATMKPKEDAVLDQPFCTFIPHVLACFPSYPEFNEAEKKLEYKPTGQKVLVKNAARFAHNARFGARGGIGGNPLVPPKGIIDLTDILKPDVYTFQCNYHPWMTAFVWVFEHPYSFITKEDGHFALKNVPIGVDLDLVVWHEAKGNFLTTQIKLKKGEVKTLEPIKIKK